MTSKNTKNTKSKTTNSSKPSKGKNIRPTKEEKATAQIEAQKLADAAAQKLEAQKLAELEAQLAAQKLADAQKKELEKDVVAFQNASPTSPVAPVPTIVITETRGEITQHMRCHVRGVKFSDKRPGVLSAIKNLLWAASAENPITKEEIVNALHELFPEREPAKMKVTVSMQVPSGLRLETKGRVSPITTVNAKGERAYYAILAPEVK